jgi:hypothetical protein
MIAFALCWALHMRQSFADLSPQELDSIRLFIEAANIQVVTEEIRGLVETHWPWLIEKLPA